MDYTKPLVEIHLPPPLVVLSIYGVFVVYFATFVVDYFILQYGRRVLPTKLVNSVIAIIHTLVPMLVISNNQEWNFLFAFSPPLIIIYGCSFPIEEFNLQNWIIALIKTTFEIRKTDADLIRSKAEIRVIGLYRFVKSCIKVMIGYKFINPWLPAHSADVLNYPPFSAEGFYFLTLFILKFYLLTGILDVFFGLEQCVLGIQTVTSMHRPYFASGPRNFWGRRWNMYVTYFIHSQIFAFKPKAEHKKSDDVKDQKKPVKQSNAVKGFLSYVISGVLHEIIVISALRKVTFEITAFFIIQGIGAFIEINLKKKVGMKGEPIGIIRVFCVVLNLIFMITTARLFTAPFLREEFFGYNSQSLSLHNEKLVFY
ncbi:hypothetical protein BDB01DRAFT_837580 [Pilobolus umbonatus]|nr:hypothetical protein BDB01DRAFT_837580 [Pilobolus umbonatus]